MSSNSPVAEGSPTRGVGGGMLVSFTDAAEILRIEHAIAVTRLLIALTPVVLLRLNTSELSRSNGHTFFLLVAYGALGLALLLVLVRGQTLPRRLPVLVQTGDICFAAIFTLLSHDLDGPSFMLLMFPLLAAGYRWGFREVVITAVALDTLLVLEWMLVRSSLGLSLGVSVELFDVSGYSAMVVIVAGLAIGYLAENENRRRAEAVSMSRIVAQAMPGADFNETLNLLLASVRDVFGAKAAMIVVLDTKTGRMFCWTTDRRWATGFRGSNEMPASTGREYFFDVPGVAWHAVAHRFWRRGRYGLVAIDKLGQRLPASELVLPNRLVTAHRWRRLLGVGLTFSNGWVGRLFVAEPALGVHRDANARFALRLANQLGGVMYGQFLVHRVRTLAQAAERGRLARQLHDGLAQSLLGLEMQMAVLRRRVTGTAPQVDEDLARFHTLLRNEIIGLRELMEEIRAGDSESDDMVEELAEMVERFRRYTGITASFQSQQPLKGVPLRTRREIARILQEALVNIRKHSNARRVLVRTDAGNGLWRLTIEDDGRGFPFAGRRSQVELDALRQGPRTISERTRMIGGEMIVESKPGTGASVVITIPLDSL
jgi:signal transduction histidine kinase